MCQIKKKAEWKFFNLEISIFFNLSKIYSAEFFVIFPVSSSVSNKKIFLTKKLGTGLVFKIDAFNGKKWVKFVAMQQDSATLIYDFNAMKGTVESYLKKKIAQPYKTEHFQAWKIAPCSVSPEKKQKTVLSHLKFYFARN